MLLTQPCLSLYVQLLYYKDGQDLIRYASERLSRITLLLDKHVSISDDMSVQGKPWVVMLQLHVIQIHLLIEIHIYIHILEKILVHTYMHINTVKIVMHQKQVLIVY
jgi:hypothetical protein